MQVCFVGACCFAGVTVTATWARFNQDSRTAAFVSFWFAHTVDLCDSTRALRLRRWQTPFALGLRGAVRGKRL